MITKTIINRTLHEHVSKCMAYALKQKHLGFVCVVQDSGFNEGVYRTIIACKNAEIVIGCGGRGEDSVDFNKLNKDIWIVATHKKDVESGLVRTTKRSIATEDIMEMKSIICDLMALNDVTTLSYRDIVAEIIERYDLDVSIDAFNGGANRAKYYFKYYYYSIKVLEYLGEVHYGSRGTITLKNKNGDDD